MPETMTEAEPTKEATTVEFTPPKGFRAPEGAKGEFDLVCTFKVRPNGELCMTKLGDYDMPVSDQKDYGRDTKPDYSEMSRGMMSDMVPMMGGGVE